jgi:zinc transport system ATP-binding protein
VAASDDTLISCEELVVGHGRRALLPAIDVRIRRGRILAVIGRNGAGKTTFLRTLLGLLPPVAGRIRRARGDLRLAYVPQAASLDDVLPVRASELVLWGRLRGWGFLVPFATADDRAARDEALRASDAMSSARSVYRDLSMGQKQRTLFARMVAMAPHVALLDEPTAAMDAMAERDALDRLVSMARRDGVAIVVVVHDLSIPARYADDALYLDRDDRVVVSGETADVFAHEEFRKHYGELEARRAV